MLHGAISKIGQYKTMDGILLLQTPRKTAFMGFIISINSVLEMFDIYVRTGKLKYLLTYKFSQDHLEIFFSAIS